MGKAFIGVDIGTTGIRAGVYDASFTLLGTGSGKSIVRRGREGELTQDPDEIYLETAGAVKKALNKAGVEPRDVAAVSFDGQMAGIMAVDDDWNAVTPYDSWLDTRCAPQVERMKKKAHRKIIEKTGIIPSFNHGPKILWWKENEGDIFDKTASFIQPSAYVAGRLCGLSGNDAFVDWTYLHFTGFSDNRALKWDEELMGLFQLPRGKLPRIVSPLEIVGEVSGRQAKAFGLLPGTPVAAGCGDTASCFLGTGAVGEGIAVDVAGTASVFALTTGRFITDPEGTVYASRSVIEGLWYTMSYINGGGLSLVWFNETFAPDSSFAKLNRAVRAVPPGSDGLIFIPHLEGRAYPNDPDLRGQWRGFTRKHSIEHFYRSILEGIGYEYAVYKEKIAGISGEDLPFNVRVVGGGAKSDVWNQIKADILANSYSPIDREDVSTLGQALVAAAAAGYVKDLARKSREVIKIRKTFYPDAAAGAVYRSSVARYKKMLGETN
jgi:xylulokinase